MSIRWTLLKAPIKFAIARVSRSNLTAGKPSLGQRLRDLNEIPRYEILRYAQDDVTCQIATPLKLI